jgi:uncharacterized protein (TIGR00369 family)
MKTSHFTTVLKVDMESNLEFRNFFLLAMKILDIGMGFSVVEIDLDQKHLQPFGLVHGGVFVSIIDAAAFWAFFYEIEDQNAGATSVDLKLNYLAPAMSGRLIARGHQIKHGKTLGYAEARVTDENSKVFAHCTTTQNKKKHGFHSSHICTYAILTIALMKY